MPNDQEEILSQGAGFYEAGDDELAKRLLWPLAQKGYAAAQYLIADMHRWGRAMEQNPHLARHYLELAADQGHAQAAFDLGMWLSPGVVHAPKSMNVFSKDAEKARHYQSIALRGFLQRASSGDVVAMHWLGFLHASGIGVAADANEAIRWYTLAFERGHHFSANGLAGIYYDSLDKGVHDQNKALFWYRRLKELNCQSIRIDELERLANSET